MFLKRRLQFRSKRQQRDISRALDGFAQPALVTRAGAGHAARKNFAAILHEGVQHVRLFVINVINLIYAETAHFPLAEKLALPALARAGSAAGRGIARTSASSAGAG